ncbi:MAG: TIM-barrel domain-containing protein [Anaerolineae bacterium]
MPDAHRFILNQPIDVSAEFGKIENTFFNAARITTFDPATGTGTLEWRRYALEYGVDFNQGRVDFVRTERPHELQRSEYARDPILPFSLSFISPRTIRLRLTAQNALRPAGPSLMLAHEPGSDHSWQLSTPENAWVYHSPYGMITLDRDPVHFEFRDASGHLLTRTQNLADTACLTNAWPTPLSFVQTPGNLDRHLAAGFTLAPDEKLYGTGESFTRLDKRGQKITLWATDALGTQTDRMYKPIPFFLSSRGYGMFVHTTAPLTLDFGHSYDQANVFHLGDDELDLFLFFGNPQEVLSEYTALTGRSPLPPLWSFGLWMSRISYESESQVREVATRLRAERIPCDVIHLDTKWFETDWRCNYQFSPSRFPDPQKLIDDLRANGFHLSLWQLPYFTPTNELYPEILERGYAVRAANGGLPTEDAILDFSNAETVKWYQGKLAGLLKLGVGAIKVDFGEAAPAHGVYASGKSGFYEHNLYPLRYNQAAAEITRQITGESIIWARSAWAGSQRYPIHWGGDAESTDSAMAATLRGGLSLGLCGFSFWSHDIGGFTQRSPRELYRRWLPFGMLTSHSRCHGQPPKEPWGYDAAFVEDFRRAVELKYRLMPYIYAQAALCSQQGYPMCKPLFFQYPDDPTAWFVEDQYLFGTDLLVAPLFEETLHRRVYLPAGQWIDYQTGRTYGGSTWNDIQAGEIPIILLVKSGAAIPHIPVAQNTAQMKWDAIELVVFGAEQAAEGRICLPTDNVLRSVQAGRDANQWRVQCEPAADIRWTVRQVSH